MRRAIVVLLLLIANAVFGMSKETAIPDTAPGRLVQEWLTAFNAADRSALREFADAKALGSARAARAGDGALAITNLVPAHNHARFGEAPKPAREARALPSTEAVSTR